MNRLEFTLISNARGLMTKRLMLDDNRLVKTAAANLYTGFARRMEVGDLTEFAEVLQYLKSNECLAYGITQSRYAKLTIKRRAGAGKIARTRDFFTWPATALWMLDYDPESDTQPLGSAELRQIIFDVMPELTGVGMLWTASASSCIWNGDEEIAGVRGQRLYIPVTSGVAIPLLGKLLTKRLWLAGHGRTLVASDGKRLKRTLIDSSVWQPERIDFAAGATCDPPLVQRRPNPVILGDQGVFFNPWLARRLTAAEEAAYTAMVGQVGPKAKGSTKADAKTPSAIRQAEYRVRNGAARRDEYLAERARVRSAGYQMIRNGVATSDIAKALDVDRKTVQRWRQSATSA